MRQTYKDLMDKTDEELYDIMLSGAHDPGNFDYQVCLDILRKRHDERLLKASQDLVRKTHWLTVFTCLLVVATVLLVVVRK
jgi:hypothetical protein